MKILIVGGCGFLGSNLAAHGIRKDNDVMVFDNLMRKGSFQNLEWLRSIGKFKFEHGDTRNENDVETLFRQNSFDWVFHLAGQVAMTTSIANPYKDFEINTIGTLNVLEAIRKYSPRTVMIYSSTNKVYGDLEQYDYIEKETRYECKQFPIGFDESVPLDFHSPYGCSKGAADQYMLDYHRIFGLKTIVFRHSSMYGSRQFATEDQGWIGWFCQKAIEKYRDNKSDPFTISGNGKQVRDILHARDMINLYFTAAQAADKIAGNAFNIGGTMKQSLSLLELFNMLEQILDIKLDYKKIAPRISDQKVFVADIHKIKSMIGWSPVVTAEQGIKEMIEWVKEA